MKFLLFLLIFSVSQSIAQDDHNHHACNHQSEVIKVDDIENIMKHLRWHGADDNQIKNALCKTKSAPTRSDIDQLVKEVSKNSTKSTVHKVQFENESTAMIEAFKQLTTAKDSFGYSLKPQNQKKIQEIYKINPECKNVMCAVEKIWGKDIGPKLVYMYLKHGFNGSELAFENSDRFTSAELDNAIIGLDDLPKHFVPLGKNQRLTRFSRGYTLAAYGSGVVANAVVMLFDLYEKESPQQKQYTIYHEMAHNMSNKLGDMDSSTSWLNLSNWTKKGDNWSVSKTGCFVSEYGRANPWEDYAESISAYRYDPKSFENACPDKYSYIKKNVYKGIEYKSEEQCSPIPKEKLSAIRSDLTHELIKNTSLNIDLEQIQKSCPGSFSYNISDSELAVCSEKILANHSVDIDQVKLKQLINKHGIKDSSYNRDLIIQGLIEQIKDSDQLKQIAHAKSGDIKKLVKSEIDESISNSIPSQPSEHFHAIDEWSWRFTVQKCNDHLWTKATDEIEKCVAKILIEEDTNNHYWSKEYFPKYTAPPLLSAQGKIEAEAKRKESLHTWITRQNISLPAIKTQKQKMKEDISKHFNYVSSTIQYSTKRKDWRTLSPQVYCETFYGKASYYTDRWGGNSILINLCIETQKNHKKRRIIKDEVVTNWIEQNL